MVQTSLSIAGDVGSIPGQGAKNALALQSKNQKHSSIITNSIDPLKY